MLQCRKMSPDDFVDTSPLDIFARLIGFCYTCTSYRVSRWRKIVNLLVINGKLACKFASEEFVYSLAPIKLNLQ